jgi:predicted Zn-dependent peptidase
MGTNSDKANFLGRFETTTKDFRTGLRLYQRIASTTFLDVQAVVNRYFDPKGRTTVIGARK